MANNILDALRRRNQLKTEADAARKQQEAYAGAFSQPQFTVGGESSLGSIGGSRFEIPSPVQVNYGDIIGKGASNFMAARKGKEAEEKDAEAQNLNMQFMQNVLGEDPQAQKLFMAAQAGLPGADKALAEHIAPKKQSMAVFMQAMTSGNLDPAMAAEVAPQFGINPDMATKAAEYAFKKKQESEDLKFGRQEKLINMRLGAQESRLTRTLDAAEERARLRNQPKSGARVSSGDGVSEPNDPTGTTALTEGGLTPGQKQILTKSAIKLQEDLQKSTMQVGKYENLRARLETGKAFGSEQKAAKVLSEFENPIVHAIGVQMRNKDVGDLEDFVLGETLTRMAQLGGNDSNEELRRMQASLPSALNNKETALHLIDELNKWQLVNREALKMRIEDMKTGNSLAVGNDDDYYARAKAKLGWQGWRDISAPPTQQEMGQPAVAAPAKRRSFDDIFDEVNR